MIGFAYWWTDNWRTLVDTVVGSPLSLVLLTSGIHPACSGDAW